MKSEAQGIKLVVVMFVLTVMTLVVGGAYTLYLRSYVDYVSMPEYTYLVVMTPIAGALTVLIVIKYFVPTKPSPALVVSSFSLAIGSLLFYVLAGIDEINSPQYYGISLSLLVWAVAILFLKPTKLIHFVSVLLLTIMTVPIPLSFISYTSTSFSHTIGRIVAWIMGAELIEQGSSLYISVFDPEGARRVFELVHACSGVISMTSILAISPLLVYLVSRQGGTYLSKTVRAAAVIGTAIGIVFVGNAARVAAVLYFTRHYSYERALEIFHQFPSVLYSALAVVASFYVLSRLSRGKKRATVLSGGAHPPPPAPGLRKYMAASMLALTILALGFTLVAPSLSYQGAVTASPPLTTLDTLLRRTGEVIFNGTGVEIVRESPVPALTARLGSSTVNLIVLKYNGSVLSGYAEVAESLSRFHSWHVCLTMQGYNVISAWKEVAEGVVISYLLIERGGQERLMGYAIYRVPFLIANGTSSAFVRVSLFASISPQRGIEAASELIKHVLTLPARSISLAGGHYVGLDALMILRDALVAVDLVAILAAMFLLLSRALRRSGGQALLAN